METPFDYFFNDRTNPRTIEALRTGRWLRRWKPMPSACARTATQPIQASCSYDCSAVSTAGSTVKGWPARMWMRRPSSSIFVAGHKAGNSAKGILPRCFGCWPSSGPTVRAWQLHLRQLVEAALGQFQQYLRQERSLSEATVINYTPVARSFLSERFPKGAVHFQQITAADITAFVQRQATLVTSKRAPLVVTALRSFLRYLFLSRHRGCRLGDVRSHHRHMVALQGAEVSCRRTDPEDLGFV